MKIVVAGSLGHIGKPLTEELVQQGHAVTVISSQPGKQEVIAGLGATAAIGSLEDAPFLADTVAGADAVFAMVPPNFTEPDQVAYYRRIGGHYAQAIRQAGVKRVVNLSSYGAHLDKGTGFILGAHHMEGILNELPGVAVTHLRAAYFYYNLYGFVDMVKQTGFIGSNYGGTDKLIMVDPTDIATVAAEELITAATGQNVRYVVSDDQTAAEAAQVLGAAIGMPDLQWVTFTDEQTQGALEGRGMPTQTAVNFVQLGGAIHSGKLREDYDRQKPVAMGKVKLTDFAHEFRAAYNQR